MYTLFTRILPKTWKRFWVKTNQENRLVSEKGYSTVDHLQTIYIDKK